jgi:hypothetical protein
MQGYRPSDTDPFHFGNFLLLQCIGRAPRRCDPCVSS